MTTRSSVPPAGRSPFSHLSMQAQAAAAAKEPKDDDVDDEDADEEDDGDDDTDENGKKTKKSKKVKKAEDDSDEKDDDKPDASAARRSEKARIRTIVNSAAGKRLPAAALNLALNSAMPRHAAVRLLARMNADVPQGASSLRDRMAGVGEPDIGSGDTHSPAAPGSAQATAAAIIAAGRRRRGEDERK